MKYFQTGDKIKVVSHPELTGKTGTVIRQLFRDDSAWCRMDADLPDKLVSFPKGDSRHRWLILFPHQCQKL